MTLVPSAPRLRASTLCLRYSDTPASRRLIKTRRCNTTRSPRQAARGSFPIPASGAHADRPELLRMLDYARAEDTIVVWRLDRLGRSLRNLVELVQRIKRTTNRPSKPPGKHRHDDSHRQLIFHVFGSLAEFERELIQEGTKAGLASARARGRFGGRRALLTEAQVAVAKQMLASPDHRVDDVARGCPVARRS